MKQEVLLALISKLISDKVEEEISSSISAGMRGPRGFRGESVEGPPGKDGKDFIFSEHKEEIESLIKKHSLKFTDLTAEEISSIRGRDGRDGKDGSSFIFSEHKEEIDSLCREYIESIKDSFKFTFNDLTADQIQQLRGPRGQRGSPGKSFNFEENRQNVEEVLKEVFDRNSDSLKIKFSDLSDKEKDSLRLKFEDLDSEQIQRIRGPRGQRGSPGRPGLDGKDGANGKDGKDGLSIRGEIGPRGLQGPQGLRGADGKDAPVVIDVRLEEIAGEIRFVFEFSDGVEIVTDWVKVSGKTSSILVGGTGSGGGTGVPGPQGDPGVPGSQYYFGAGVPSNSLYIDGDIYQDTDNGDQYKKISGVWVLQDNITGPQGLPGTGGGSSTELIENVDCESDVYVGAAVYMKQSTPIPSVMSDWTTLSSVINMDYTTYISLAANAIADNYSRTNVIGLVESKSSAVKCTIRIAGVTTTNYSSLDVVEEYYLSDTIAGGIVDTANAPTAVGHVLVRIGQPISFSQMLYQRGERIVRA